MVWHQLQEQKADKQHEERSEQPHHFSYKPKFQTTTSSDLVSLTVPVAVHRSKNSKGCDDSDDNSSGVTSASDANVPDFQPPDCDNSQSSVFDDIDKLDNSDIVKPERSKPCQTKRLPT